MLVVLQLLMPLLTVFMIAPNISDSFNLVSIPLTHSGCCCPYLPPRPPPPVPVSVWVPRLSDRFLAWFVCLSG